MTPPAVKGDAVSLILHSTRFGEVEIDPDSVIVFPRGLVGLGGKRYALLRTKAESPFVWLHSLEDPGLALPVTNPHRFFADFALELDDGVAAELGIDATTVVDVLVTVRAAERLEDFAVNLKAPIIVRDGVGHQVINQAPHCELRVPLFPAGSVAAPAT